MLESLRLERVIENSKEAYYLALRQTQSTLNTEQTRIGSHGCCFSFARCSSRNVVLPPRLSASNPLSR